MKHLLLSFLFSILCVTAWSQTFEGEVLYNAVYKSKMSNLTDDQFTTMAGNTLKYYIKGGNYRADANGSYLIWQIYINADNKLYNKFGVSSTIYWQDAGVSKDSILSVQLNKGVITILGYKCDELILNCKSGIEKYYFSSKLPVDSKLYQKHVAQNWYAYLKRANAMPLKMIIDNAQSTITMTATAVTPKTLDDAMFTLPAGAQIDKLPSSN
jgi:hypothetical protein